MNRVPPPSTLETRLPIRKILGCISKQPVKVGFFFIQVKGELLSYHDLYHIEVSCLERIPMGKHQVSGIHGINSPIFHNLPIVEEYDSYLDEARVALHEWLTRTSVFNTIKAMLWIVWLVLHGINPIAVIGCHIRSMKRNPHYMVVRENLNLVSQTQESCE